MSISRTQAVAAATVSGLISLSAVAFAASHSGIGGSPTGSTPAVTTPIVEERTEVDTKIVHRIKHADRKGHGAHKDSSSDASGSAPASAGGTPAASSDAPSSSHRTHQTVQSSGSTAPVRSDDNENEQEHSAPSSSASAPAAPAPVTTAPSRHHDDDRDEQERPEVEHHGGEDD